MRPNYEMNIHIVLKSKKDYLSHYSEFHDINRQVRFNITNIIPHNPDDGSLEPKRYSVDFASHIYIYIYIYIYI